MIFIYYVVLFEIYSICGWLVEVTNGIIRTHKFSNRGFLIGPYCPIYGCGCLAFIFFLKDYTSDLIGLFLKTIIICSILEYFTSYIMEKLFKTRWWDYSNRKFNINGRICLENLIPFGILGCFVIYIINPFFLNILNSVNINIVNIVGIIVLIILVVDFIVSFKIIFNIRGIITSVAKDNTEEITRKVKQILKKSRIYRRFIKAFPKFKISKIIKLKK